MQRGGSPSTRCARTRAALAICLWLAGAWGCTSVYGRHPDGAGSVQGEVRFTGAAEAGPELGPAVVFLAPADGTVPVSAGTLTIADGSGGLGRDLIVLARGQSLRIASNSGVTHRLFAVRGAARVDVEVPADGRSLPLPMQEAGFSRFYCSLHQEETWDVFVAPSPHFARLGPDGGYRIENVPPGDYQLSIWSAAVEGTVRTVHVGLDTATLEPIWLDPAKVGR